MSNALNRIKQFGKLSAELFTRLLRVAVARFFFEPLMSVVGGFVLTEAVFLLGSPLAVADFYGVEAVRTQFYTVVSVIVWVWIVDDPAGLLDEN